MYPVSKCMSRTNFTLICIEYENSFITLRHPSSCSATEASQNLENLYEASLSIVLSGILL